MKINGSASAAESRDTGMDDEQKLRAELADARKRRNRLAFHKREIFDPWEKGMWNQSIKVVRKTIKRLKKELEKYEPIAVAPDHPPGPQYEG